MTISRLSAFVVAAALGVLLTMVGDARQADPGVLLRAAIEKEDVAGDLEGAMALYRQIIAANGKNRTVTAKALLRLGGCHEKLGQAEARKVYERLVAEYSDQAAEVASARQKLAGLAALTKIAEPPRPTFRKIRVPTKLPTTGSGKLSPDGQTLAFIADGSLWTLPVHGKSDPNIAGAPVRLTEPMHAWDNANVSIEWSVDGKWIAFRVAVPQLDRRSEEELYVVPAAGGTPRRLPISWQDWADNAYTLRYALSGGGEVLYFAAGTELDELCVFSMSARDGDRRAVTTPITRQPALSPDGSRIAYVKGEKGEGRGLYTKEIWVASVDGTAAQLAYRLPGEALAWVQGPIWSPDGRMLAFLASARGNRFTQVLVLPLRKNGSAAAEPARFDLPVTTNGTSDILAGWTPDNRVGILIPGEEQTAIYRIPASGGRAVQLTPKAGWMPAWAPDGKRIYFDGIHGGGMASIEFVPAEGGAVERLPRDPEYERWQPAYPHAGLSMSPDGQSICVASFDSSGVIASGIFILPVRGGRPTRLTTGPESEPQWSPDGARIAFIRPEQTTGAWSIFVIPRDGGEPRQVTTPADRVQMGSLAWSPDGQAIAFFARDNTLRVAAVGGGASRILTKVTGGLRWLGTAWSPDGHTIAYVSEGALWRIPAAGGAPARIETGLDARLEKIAWSPDGKSIAFGATSGGEHELWLMEDFLHLVKAPR
jgi:Tol biopolymer transport system component